MLRWKFSRPLLIAITVIFAILPFAGDNPLSKAGLQQTMAVAFLFGALALTYDLLFGFTGLLSSDISGFICRPARPNQERYLTAEILLYFHENFHSNLLSHKL
jgi:hypothetical protein